MEAFKRIVIMRMNLNVLSDILIQDRLKILLDCPTAVTEICVCLSASDANHHISNILILCKQHPNIPQGETFLLRPHYNAYDYIQ